MKKKKKTKDAKHSREKTNKKIRNKTDTNMQIKKG